MRADPRCVATAGTYLLEQRIRYSYESPARALRHRLVVVPRAEHGGQRRLDYGINVLGSRAIVAMASDGFANELVELRAESVAEWIEFETWALVDLAGPGSRTEVPAASLTDPRLLDSTALTRADDALRDGARELAATGDRGAELAERICEWSRSALQYEWGITNVRTTAAQALAGGRGVCQDYAHIMLALCRELGLAARYVSGHLVGEGGSHAWVEVIVRADGPTGTGPAVAIAFDPTHNRRAESGYLTVAVGRDYADVAPTSGTFRGRGVGLLSTRKRLDVATLP